MKTMKSTKKKRNQDVYLRFGRLAAGLLDVLHALHGEKWCSKAIVSRQRRPGGLQALCYSHE